MCPHSPVSICGYPSCAFFKSFVVHVGAWVYMCVGGLCRGCVCGGVDNRIRLCLQP